MRKSTVFWLSTTMLFLGTILGLLLSPARGGMSFGNYNENKFGEMNGIFMKNRSKAPNIGATRK